MSTHPTRRSKTAATPANRAIGLASAFLLTASLAPAASPAYAEPASDGTAATEASANAEETSYDPRPLGLTSGVRNQAPWGMCWAFAGMAAVESYAIANGLASSSIDLSEEAIPWSVLNAAKEASGISPAYGWMTRGTRDDSGYGDMVTGYLMSGKGPKLESDIPYYTGSESDPMGIYYEETPPEKLSTAPNALEITDIAYLDDASPEEVKEAIRNYGGVATSCNLSLDLYNPDTAALWCPAFSESYANHSICIVGWDDSFPKENFASQEGELPHNDGAWLVKNSELADGAVAPYIWVSYEDGTILQDNPHSPNYAIAGARPATDRTVYALDSDGAVATVSSKEASSDGKATLACANVYDFAAGERLSEVMFMTTSKGAGYRILYYPVDENHVPDTDPSRAIILAEGTVEHAGYTTVEVDESASVPSGYGAIAIELVSSDGAVTLGTDQNVDEYGNPLYTADPQTEIRSFYLRDGAAEPAYSDPHSPVTFVLRAYGVEADDPAGPSLGPDTDPGTDNVPNDDGGENPDDETGPNDPDNLDDDAVTDPSSNADPRPDDNASGQGGNGLARTGDSTGAVLAATACAALLGALAAARALAARARFFNR